ncbi:hypothetical protein Salat_2812400 [Sesamum alatum]|uniref:Uncharacterized protein n=1 Tax=Sesamum alatum TaxID=300844 RepID=A0AAE1XLC9_9LAMI|nr:hypothetical protein Salat_2812400 [Sesamum alatum]
MGQGGGSPEKLGLVDKGLGLGQEGQGIEGLGIVGDKELDSTEVAQTINSGAQNVYSPLAETERGATSIAKLRNELECLNGEGLVLAAISEGGLRREVVDGIPADGESRLSDGVSRKTAEMRFLKDFLWGLVMGWGRRGSQGW